MFYGSNAVFNVTATGTAPLAYQWFKDGTLIWQRTNSHLTVSNTTWSSQGTYLVHVTNVAGAVTSAPAHLRVHLKPGLGYFPNQPVSEIPYGGQFYAEIRESGTSGERCQWQFNGEDIPGATNSVLQLVNMKPAESGAYRYVTFHPPGPLYSEPIQVQVGRANPVQHAGHYIVLDAGTGLGFVESFQWLHADVPIPGATAPTYELWPLSEEDAGDYSCRIAWRGEERTVEVARLTVLPARPTGRVVHWTSDESGLVILGQSMQNVVQVSAQESIHIALQADGSLVQWGRSGCEDNVRPLQLSNVVAVAAGETGSLALFNDGSVTAWSACYCEACFAPTLNNVVSIAIGHHHGLALLNDSTVTTWGSGGVAPPGLTNVIAIAAGSGHSLVLMVDGTLLTWQSGGGNPALEIPAGLDSVKAIACGSMHSLALRSDGTVVAWGSNFSGQTSVPPNLNDVQAVGAGSLHSYAVKSDGSVVVWGEYGMIYPPGIPGGLTNVVAITGGGHSSLALSADGETPVLIQQPQSQIRSVGEQAVFSVKAFAPAELTYQWTFNGVPLEGQTTSVLIIETVEETDWGDYGVVVSNGAANIASKPARLNVIPDPFLSHDGKPAGILWAWGRPDAAGASPWFTNVVAISSGASALDSFAITADGRGWRIQGDEPYVVQGHTNLYAIASGANHRLALLNNGTLLGWGDNSYDQVAFPQDLTGIAAIACGYDFSLALRTNRALVAWGWSTNLFTEADNGFIAISAGQNHALALREDGTVTHRSLPWTSG